MNANGDERIDHDEFVNFFLKMLMGSYEQKMLIAFNCYDVDGDECIDKKEVRVVLRNIPLTIGGRFGASFLKDHQRLSRIDYLNMKNDDNQEIDILLTTLYKEFDKKNEGDGMYFDEFVRLAEDVTSELFICIYNCIY